MTRWTGDNWQTAASSLGFTHYAWSSCAPCTWRNITHSERRYILFALPLQDHFRFLFGLVFLFRVMAWEFPNCHVPLHTSYCLLSLLVLFSLQTMGKAHTQHLVASGQTLRKIWVVTTPVMWDTGIVAALTCASTGLQLCFLLFVVCSMCLRCSHVCFLSHHPCYALEQGLPVSVKLSDAAYESCHETLFISRQRSIFSVSPIPFVTSWVMLCDQACTSGMRQSPPALEIKVGDHLGHLCLPALSRFWHSRCRRRSCLAILLTLCVCSFVDIILSFLSSTRFYVGSGGQTHVLWPDRAIPLSSEPAFSIA